MTTIALNNLWRYLQGLALTEKDRKWLAGKLQEPSLSPYTQEELDSMIKQSEQDLKDENYRDVDELFSEWDEENSTFFAAEPQSRSIRTFAETTRQTISQHSSNTIQQNHILRQRRPH